VETAVFVLAAVVAIATALGVVLARTPVYSAIFLIANFFSLATLYLLLNASFLAAVQVLVYAGAIMVLFLFVVMLLSPGKELQRLGGLPGQLVGAIVVVVISLASLAWLATQAVAYVGTPSVWYQVHSHSLSSDYGTAPALGRALFNRYLLPFEVTALLLLVAVVGVVLLARQSPTPEPTSEGTP
jgi:NADH-quinone oxidoreductase subunit J